ncbi:Mediator of RNA polymerase II transcription subunit [Trichinella pseudospiralis]
MMPPPPTTSPPTTKTNSRRWRCQPQRSNRCSNATTRSATEMAPSGYRSAAPPGGRWPPAPRRAFRAAADSR